MYNYELRITKYELRIIRLRVGEVPRFLRRDRRKGEEKRELCVGGVDAEDFVGDGGEKATFVVQV